ncbi:MAG: ABC transporter permease [Rhodobacteraceae bacterium]|nr:ABC transporter permease [Paracoccaceae bacterium]
MVSGASVALDPAAEGAFFAAVKATPGAGFVVPLRRTLARFRETLAQNITIFVTIYTALAAIVAVGVVYNFARIALSEQGRELASLRVLGFTQGEVAGVLSGEIALIVAAAQPLGWALGYGFALAMAAAFSSDLYQVPLVIGRDVFALASLVVILSAVASAALIRRRIGRLDMIEVLKTRE